MRGIPRIDVSSHPQAAGAVRFLARHSADPSAVLIYWLGSQEPTREPSFFAAMQRFGPLMQLVLPDERPGVFVNRSAVGAVHGDGVVKQLVFKDGSSLDVRYDGSRANLLAHRG
jgi:hypothetical protein